MEQIKLYDFERDNIKSAIRDFAVNLYMVRYSKEKTEEFLKTLSMDFNMANGAGEADKQAELNRQHELSLIEAGYRERMETLISELTSISNNHLAK